MRRSSLHDLLKFILSNTCFVSGIVLIVFTVLDRFNPMMGFVTSAFSQGILWIFMICAVVLAILALIELSRKK